MKTKLAPPKKGDVKWFLLSGFFGFFLYMIAFNQGCKTVPAATSSVIIAIVPVITTLFARVFYHEKVSVIQWIATGVEFAGVVVLKLLDSAFSLSSGILLLLVAAVALSAYNLLQRKLTKAYSGLQASAYSIFAGTAMLAVFLPGAVREVRAAPPTQLIYVAILGVFSSALAYVTWAQAMKKAKHTASVSNYMFVTPFVTSLLGLLLAGETLDPPTIAGGSVIMAGVLIFHFGDRIFGKMREWTKKHAVDLPQEERKQREP
ncbi:hypothetical protein SDC9_155500 [bioreactor metagenome]|uniref:EamA domain-containing protein n=1 Tax=bioreactor metagenome TaxID=1076179 RepID=A0A645F1N4_9ZZZZ